jgi:transposase-like protein
VTAISAPQFHDQDEARKYLERLRWPQGPICPKCGVVGHAYETKRPGVYRCAEPKCRKDFTVMVGTLFERSHVPLNKWLMAAFLISASKKGMSAHQLMRMLDVTYKTAWFLAHRLREAMREGNFPGQIGGANKVVEVDETYIGGKDKNRHAHKRAGIRGGSAKEAVVALVERGGKVRSRHVADVNAKTLRPILEAQIDAASNIMTDEAKVYPAITGGFASHDSVNHGADEYVRLGGFVHTNTVENYFSILKRGIYGTYHHVSAVHLKRYAGEFDFRYNNREITDSERADVLLLGIEGKRLTYREVGPRS